HVPADAVPTGFGHSPRALRPGGPRLLGVHVGDESRLKTQDYGGHPMKVYVHRRQPCPVHSPNASVTRSARSSSVIVVSTSMTCSPRRSVSSAARAWRRRRLGSSVMSDILDDLVAEQDRLEAILTALPAETWLMA